MGQGQVSPWVLSRGLIKSPSELTLAPDRSFMRDGFENLYGSCVTVGRGVSEALSQQPGIIRPVHVYSWR